MAISDWPAEERPREKLISKGPASLSDAELLAIFLRTGSRGLSAVDLARDLLSKHSGLGELLAADRDTFCSHPGLGDAKYCQLQAVLEMARRHFMEKMIRNDIFCNPDDSRAFVYSKLAHRPNEVFACLLLDNRHRLIEYRELFQGTIDGAQVYPREVLRVVLQKNAAAVIFAHNHPSGVAEPSVADRQITQQLKSALQMVEVRVLDHLVVGAGEVTSLAELGFV